MAERTMSLVADDQAFSLAPFLGLPWAGLGNNAQHIAAGRGRLVASHLFDQQFFGGIVDAEFRYVFDATPLETHYSVCPVVRFSEIIPSMFIGIEIASEDILGNNPDSDTHTTTWYRQQDNQPSRPESRITWPQDLNQIQGTSEYALGWFLHTVDPALATQGRVLIVTLSASGGLSEGFEMAAVGCAIVGVRL